MRHGLSSFLSLSDALALVAAGCVITGLAWVHPAAAWIAAGVAFGFVSVELGKHEAGFNRPSEGDQR